MKKTFPADSPVYGILTDPQSGYERLAAIMVDSGIRVIQLRMKDCPVDEITRTGLALRRVIPAEVLFIMNDDPRIAVDVGADGVHLGQDDMSFAEARKIMGPDAVIGLSTHSPEQTVAACALKPDYIGVGPVYPTPTKKCPDRPIGLKIMKQMIDLATVPSVCLGGIDSGNAADVAQAGARMVCAVRSVNRADDPAAEIASLIDAVRGNRRD